LAPKAWKSKVAHYRQLLATGHSNDDICKMLGELNIKERHFIIVSLSNNEKAAADALLRNIKRLKQNAAQHRYRQTQKAKRLKERGGVAPVRGRPRKNPIGFKPVSKSKAKAKAKSRAEAKARAKAEVVAKEEPLDANPFCSPIWNGDGSGGSSPMSQASSDGGGGSSPAMSTGSSASSGSFA